MSKTGTYHLPTQSISQMTGEAQHEPYLSPSASSVASTILPTPGQAHESRRDSLRSPEVMSAMSPPVPTSPRPYLVPEEKEKRSDPFYASTTTQQLSTSSVPEPYTPEHARPLATISHPGMSSSSRRRVSQPTPRAPPPPPILLRRPTDLNGVTAVDIPLRTGSSASSSRQPSPIHDKKPTAKGLNIAGLPGQTEGSVEKEEEADELPALPELVPSPRRAFFASADPNGAPKSPAWQSFEVPSLSPASPSRNHRHRASVELPFSPLGPNSGEKRFDPTPTHGIHSRNLSLFFPSPGSQAQAQVNGRLSVPGTPSFTQSPEEVPQAVMHAGSRSSKQPFGGSGNWTFGQGQAASDENGRLTPETAKRGKRRGHHHKHSLSHNFFSFLDPTQTNPDLARSPSPVISPSPKMLDTPQPVPMPFATAPSLMPSSPTLSPLPPKKHNPQKQLLVSFAVLESLIGAGLWIEGQISGWRCLAGVGYLVVFDAIGVAVGMFTQSEEGWRSIRRPYGVTRLAALLLFTQSLFLVFAATYIAKEAIEQVMLGSGAHDHGGASAHSHGSIAVEGDERPFPHFLLLSAMFASVFSGSYLHNHSKLVEAVGPLFLPYRYMTSALVKRSKDLGNPFSVTIAAVPAAILLGSIMVPPAALHTLDSSMSLLLTILTVALSHPPTLAFGNVLLQTAPSPSSGQMKALKKALKDVENDRRILGLGTMRCWTIGAAAAPPQKDDGWSFTTPSHSRNPSLADPSGASPQTLTPESPTKRKGSPSNGLSVSRRPSSIGNGLGLGSIGGFEIGKTEAYTPMVVNLTIHAHPDVSDRDIIDITKSAWTKIDLAVGRKGRSGAKVGEISIGVKRGWEGG